MYYTCSGLLEVFCMMLFGVIFTILTKFNYGISLLKAVSSLFVDGYSAVMAAVKL